MATDSRAPVHLQKNARLFEDEIPRLMLREAGMTMELSDRYELMDEDFKRVIKKTEVNLELYMNIYLNAIKKPRATNGWDRIMGVMTGNVLRCRQCKAMFSNSDDGREQF